MKGIMLLIICLLFLVESLCLAEAPKVEEGPKAEPVELLSPDEIHAFKEQYKVGVCSKATQKSRVASKDSFFLKAEPCALNALLTSTIFKSYEEMEIRMFAEVYSIKPDDPVSAVWKLKPDQQRELQWLYGLILARATSDDTFYRKLMDAVK